MDGSLLLDTIERCYFRFRRRRRDVRQATSCDCNACVRIPDLNLKFVVHHGTILRQRVAGQEELLGPDVILVHRLLKNDVIASTGIEAYALFSQQCVDAMDIDVSALGMRASSETYEHIGVVPVWVHDLDRRWQEEEARKRVIVDERHAVYRFDTSTSAPPQVAWEFLTTPGRRTTWQVGVTGVKVIATGNRRGSGPQPLHARRWRDHRGGPRLASLRLLHLPEHRPDSDGARPLCWHDGVRANAGRTIVHQRFAAPKTPKGAPSWST